jgi:hypothetical protein
MFDIVENYLTLSGGSKETLRKIAEAFSGLSTKGVFESLIGRNPLFDDDSYRSNHDKTTYGTIDEICSLEIIDSGNDSGVLFIRFRTEDPPIGFMLVLSRLYELDALINYELSGDPHDSGKLYVSSGSIIDYAYLADISYKYYEESEIFLENLGEEILAWAIKYYRDENELINKDLWYMSDEDKEYLLEQFRQKKAASIKN